MKRESRKSGGNSSPNALTRGREPAWGGEEEDEKKTMDEENDKEEADTFTVKTFVPPAFRVK